MAPAPVTAEQKTTVRVIVKLRDLDTDARTVFEHEVPPPRSPGEERTRLIEVVAEHKPDAEIRSFANHVASFVDSEHLVVAYFEEPSEIRKALRELARQHGQRELFPATPEEEAA
jgi:hypothetical protein